MKNSRNGEDDVSPPLKHADERPCISKIGINGVAVAITPGPVLKVVRPTLREPRS